MQYAWQLCIVLALALKISSKKVQFDVEKDIMILEAPKSAFSVPSVVKCSVICGKTDWCKSGMYDRTAGLCNLYANFCPRIKQNSGTKVILKNEPEPPTTNVCPNGWMAFKNYCYLFRCNMVDWYSAKVECDSFKGHLVSLRSSEEHSWVLTNLTTCPRYNKNYDFVWTGVTDYVDEGRWLQDHNCRRPRYYNWADSEPNSYFGDAEDFVNLDGRRNNLMNDDLSTTMSYFICRKEQL